MTPVRETGQFPLSIGTSLALEGLFGHHPNQPRQPSGHKGINALWINLRTLVRNYHNAMKAEDAERLNYHTAALGILAEIQAIPDIVKTQRAGIQVVFYHQPLEYVKRQFPNANYRRPKTDKQTKYQTYENITMVFLLSECANADIQVQQITTQPPSGRQITAMLSHYPKDLLWKSSFERLFLLESHSGKLKTYVDWYTKLNYVKSDQPVPLNEFTIQVFGDKDLFLGQEKRLRDEVLSLAKLRKWNGSTSMSKVRTDIMANGSPAIKRCFKELLP